VFRSYQSRNVARPRSEAQVEGGQNQPRPNVASTSQHVTQIVVKRIQEVDLTLEEDEEGMSRDQTAGNAGSLSHVASRIRQEEAVIAQTELEKKEAEEKIQRLDQEIRARRSKVKIWRELLG